MTTAGASLLAIDGGDPLRRKAWPPWPFYGPDEIEAVSSVLRSGKVNYWTGEEGRHFETEYAGSLGRRYAVAVMNGTVALELALYSLGIGRGDEVITSCRTFIASASAAVMRGAKPVLADVDADSGNVTAETIAAVLTPRTRAIVVVHLGGWPCEMEPIVALARREGVAVIEDCAQAHGATYHGRPVGSFCDAAAFSFCQDKIISTGGEGGLFVTDDPDVWRRAWAYKDHGKSYAAVYERLHPPGFRWLHESFGTNWRMTELQAGIGRRQLKKLPEWVAIRRRNAAVLTDCLRGLPGLRLPSVPPACGHAYYRYYCYLDPSKLKTGWDQARVIQAVNAEGIPCFTGTCPELYRERAFSDAGWGQSPAHVVARDLGESSVCFLTHPTLQEDDMRDAAEATGRVLSVACL